MKQTYLTKTSIILMAFMLSASPAIVKTSAAATTPEDSAPVTTSEAGASLKLSKKTYEKKFQTKKGLVYKTISYEYPLAEGDSDAADAFNQFYDTLRTSWIKSARKNLEEAKKAVKDLEGLIFPELICFTATVRYAVMVSIFSEAFHGTIMKRGISRTAIPQET